MSLGWCRVQYRRRRRCGDVRVTDGDGPSSASPSVCNNGRQMGDSDAAGSDIVVGDCLDRTGPG